MKQNKFIRRLNLFFRSTGLFFTIGAALWLALCTWAAYRDVSVNESILSLFSFSNVFAVAANVFFLFFWLFTQRKKFSIIPLLGLILCFSVTKSSFGVNLLGATVKAEDQALKVMTWNVHLFDLGEWTKNKQSKNKIIEFISEQAPDILCLQEYYVDADNLNEPYVELLRGLGYNYYEFSIEDDYPKRNINIEAKPDDVIKVGHAVFSKFPLSKMHRYALDLKRNYYNLMGVDVDLGEEKKIRLYVTHLQSVTLSNEEVAYAEEKTAKLPTKVESKTKGILTKLILASSKRAMQANIIDSITDKATLPTIICGDMNDMPGSYVYRKVKGDLSDAFVNKGFGFGRTYRNIFPTLRIDYIFYDSKFFTCKGYSSPDVALSDHNPVLASFSINSTESK